MDYARFCPGSISIRQPIPEFVECPRCGEEVEIWTDEITTRCQNCQMTISRDRAPSCIDWCKFAKDCLGVEAYNRLKGGGK
jgi:hypothetical protein